VQTGGAIEPLIELIGSNDYVVSSYDKLRFVNIWSVKITALDPAMRVLFHIERHRRE